MMVAGYETIKGLEVRGTVGSFCHQYLFSGPSVSLYTRIQMQRDEVYSEKGFVFLSMRLQEVSCPDISLWIYNKCM